MKAKQVGDGEQTTHVLVFETGEALKGGEPQVHAHVVVARSDGSAYGVHLLEAHVWPTLEVVLVETPAHLQRELDEATGLPLIRL